MSLSSSNLVRFFSALLTVLLLATSAHAATTAYRWSNSDLKGANDSLKSILPILNKSASTTLTESDFKETERRDLANHRFTQYVFLVSNMPVGGSKIRAWTNLKTGEMTLLEAHIEASAVSSMRQALLQKSKLSYSALKAKTQSLDTMSFVRQALLKTSDQRIANIKWDDQWNGNDLQRVVEVTSRRGTHEIIISHFKNAIVSATYKQFPQADTTVDALVYPIYEEAEKDIGTVLKREPVQLKNLLPQRKDAGTTDPYASLRNRRYYDMMFDPVKAETPEGQAAGYWSFDWFNRVTDVIYNALPWVDNSYASGGVLLVGKYATINLHPEVQKISGIKVPLTQSGQINYIWKPAKVGGIDTWEVIPMGVFAGQSLTDAKSGLGRVAQRLPDHNAATYINDGFDELQVYYAIDRLMESLHGMGFSDPQLSTWPFHAFLYDPDISMRDNAYYTNNTINFTTYSPKNQNYARDNTTIWHELGHGVMDRLMGQSLKLADTGGLAEGMADFIAQLVIQDVTDSKAFPGSGDLRIVNRTSFHLTNESHDDGEAYGGAMKDMMDAAIATYGRNGLVMITDLTLEAMRFSRNHPGLTANDWFDNMLFADATGSPLRKAGIFKQVIIQALETRNFRLDRGQVADAQVKIDNTQVLDSEAAGSRYNPIIHALKPGQTASHTLGIKLTSSSDFAFKYPVKVEVSFNGGPLQGAVKWINESAGAQVATIKSEADLAKFTVGAEAGCDFVNREDGTCSDFAYIKIYNNGEAHPAAKKRFYLLVSTSAAKK